MIRMFTGKFQEFEKNLNEISANCYSREYYLGRFSQKKLKYFRKGGRPGAVLLQALKYIPINSNGPFLDVGCGQGEMAIYLARLGKRVYGIDYSPEAIRLSQENLRFERKSVQTRVNFQVADCTTTPFADNKFSCLFLLDIVEHLSPRQLRLTVKEVNRILKRDGVLVIHTNNKHFEKMTKLFVAAAYHGIKVFFKARTVLREFALDPYEYLHINYLTGEELYCYLEKAGFDARIEYVKPRRKSDIRRFVPLGSKWREWVLYNTAWFVLNSPLIKFFSPTFWIVARKTK